jgi:hypothetical protein
MNYIKLTLNEHEWKTLAAAALACNLKPTTLAKVYFIRGSIMSGVVELLTGQGRARKQPGKPRTKPKQTQDKGQEKGPKSKEKRRKQ